MQTVTVDYASWRRDSERIMANERRLAYLEGQLSRIANGNWQSPPIDSEGANTYAHIVSEMQNIAKLALTAIVAE